MEATSVRAAMAGSETSGGQLDIGRQRKRLAIALCALLVGLIVQLALASSAEAVGWVAHKSGVTSQLNGVDCPTSETCYAVGNAGKIRKSADAMNGEKTWSGQSSNTSHHLLAIACPSTSTCYAVGYSGTILKTSNAGSTWTSENSGVDEDLYSVSCPTVTTCYATGDFGTLRRTTDGSMTTWVSLGPGMSSTVQGISCPLISTCYIVGGPDFDTSIIRKTTDAGATWSGPSSGGAPFLRGISCSSADICKAVGFSGTILKTANGSTWSSQQSGTSSYLIAVSCPSNSTCYAVGHNGTIRKTTGGSSWFGESSGTSSNLLGLSCASTSACWAVGAGGKILHRDAVAPAKPTITAKPSNPSEDRSPSFAWAGAEAGGSFQCRLDTPAGNGSFASCSSPKTYSGLADGEHTFRVRQIDDAGSLGSAQTYTWTVGTVFSDDCENPEATVTDGFVGTTYVMVRVAQPSASKAWICAQAADADAKFGGKFVVDASKAPGAPSVDQDPGSSERCSSEPGNIVPGPHPIDGEFGDPGAAGYANVALDSYANGDEAWMCVFAQSNPGGTLERQVVVPFGAGVVDAVRFEPDTIPAIVPDPPTIGDEPSARCQDNDDSPGYQRVLNSDAGDEHLWLDAWRESDSRAHLCVRNKGTATVGGRLTLDTAGGLGVTPVIEVHDDMTGCTLQVFKSEALDIEVRRSSETANPASLCARQGATEKRVTVGISTGSPGIVRWTPDGDNDVPIPTLP